MLFKGYFRISERNFCYILFKYFVQCIFLVLCTFSSLLVRIYSSSLWNRYIWMKMFYSFCTDFNIALKVLGYLRSSCVRPLLIEYTVNLKSAFSSMSSDPLSWIVCTQLFDKKCPFTAAPTQFFGVYSLFCYAKMTSDLPLLLQSCQKATGLGRDLPYRPFFCGVIFVAALNKGRR